MERTASIAIDGPSAAGKSTLARGLAERLGFLYVDTGALYRAIGYHALSQGVAPDDEARVVPLLAELDLELVHREGLQRIVCNGEDVSEKIRLPEMSMAASKVSAIPAVREFLLDLQRTLAREQSVVMDGRDIGTVVLPGADVKFFLTASPEIRARRRCREFEAKGQAVDYEALLAETIERDFNDTHRAAAPLRQADDAVVVDSTDLSLAQTLDRLLELSRDRL